MPRPLEEMSALPVLASFFAVIALTGLGLAKASVRVGRLSEGGQVALDAVRKTAVGQLLASFKLQLGALLVVAGLAALGGSLRGNGWFLPFFVVPLCAVGALFMAWIGASAGLLEIGAELTELKGPTGVHRLARRVLGATLFAQATGALVGLGLGHLDSAYGIRLAPWAAAGVALSAVFVALAAATLEPLTLQNSRPKEPSPTNLGAAAALGLLRPMRSLLLLAGIALIAFDKFTRGLTSTDPTDSEAGTFLLLVLAGSALATLMGGLAVRPSEQEESAEAFGRGTWTALLILMASVALARGHDDAPHRTRILLWSLGLGGTYILAFFLPALFGTRRGAERSLVPSGRVLLMTARAPLLAAVALLAVRLFEPNLNATTILLALSVALAPVALLSSLAADYRRGSAHLAWLALHKSLAEAAIQDDSLEHKPLIEIGIFGLFLLSMEGPSYDLSQLSPLLIGPLVLLGGLGIAAALASHRRTLEEPMRQSELLQAAGSAQGSPLTRPVELGERVVPGAGRPLLLFLGLATALGLLAQTSFIPQAILTPLLLGLWLGALLLGVGLSSFLSSEPTSPRFSVGPLALTLSFSLGTLLAGLQTIVL